MCCLRLAANTGRKKVLKQPCILYWPINLRILYSTFTNRYKMVQKRTIGHLEPKIYYYNVAGIIFQQMLFEFLNSFALRFSGKFDILPSLKMPWHLKRCRYTTGPLMVRCPTFIAHPGSNAATVTPRDSSRTCTGWGFAALSAFFCPLWPWPLTFDLQKGRRPVRIVGQHACKISRS